MKKVVVIKPTMFAGTVAILNGNRFRYPGQKFWVQPVLINGKNQLVTEFKEIEESMDNLNLEPGQRNPDCSFLYEKKFILNMDPTIVYDYQNLLAEAYCPSCKAKLDWRIAVQASAFDDRFCRTECCGMIYSMVPDKVRVVAIPAALMKEDEEAEADDNFLEQLRKM